LKTLGELLEGVAYLDYWRNKEKEDHESAIGHQDPHLHHISLQVLSCMYVSFSSFGNGICMWIFGCDPSLAWRMAKINSGFPSLSISWIVMVLVGLFPHCFFGSVSCFISLA